MVNFCTSPIPGSRILDIARRSDAAPGKPGSVLIVTFKLAAAQHRTLNGDPIFQFTEAISLSVDCGDQAEVDYLWAGLGAGGS